MQLTTLHVLVSSLLGLSFAVCLHAHFPTSTYSYAQAPAEEHALVPRQTYIITCIGNKCDDGSTPTPTPKPTASKTPEPPTTSTKPTKSSQVPVQPTKTSTGEEVGPSSTRCPVPLYYKCGGWDVDKPWAGCTVCVKGAKCVVQNGSVKISVHVDGNCANVVAEWYYQCVADDGPS
ncbi:hypothetical protein ACEQ8H_006102 [Pleosporales sp. CAS-2024a]